MLEITLDSARLNAALRELGAKVPGLQDKIVRKLAFDGVRDIVVSITTGAWDNPIRVDTGRYRAAWGVGSMALGLGAAGPLVDNEGRKPGPTDARGKVTTTEGRTMAVITNAVEYAEAVEYGTLYMRPGHHVAVALQRVAEDGEELILALGTAEFAGAL